MTQCLTKKNFGLSYCRSLATIAIIVLHTGFILSTTFKFSTDDNIILRLFVNCSMWAVPIFLMVTGVLNLNPQKDLPLKKLIKKYIARIFIAIAIFIAIYQVIDIFINHQSLGFNQILLYFENLYRGKTYSPMWYLYMLIGLYLMMPMYRAFVMLGHETEIKFILIIYIIFISIIPAIGTFKFTSGFYIHELTIYPFYMFVGYVLNKGIVKIDRYKGVALFIVSTILISFLTFIRWKNNNENLEVFWSYSSFFVILQSIGMFNLIMGSTYNLEWEGEQNRIEKAVTTNSKLKRVFSSFLIKIDDCSFGIYLLHIIFIRVFVTMDFVKTLINNNSIYVILPLLVIVNLFLSYIITRCIKNIPVFKFIL